MEFETLLETCQEDVLEKVTSFLAVPDVVFFGCTCRSFKARCEVVIGRKMVLWKKSIKERELQERRLLKQRRRMEEELRQQHEEKEKHGELDGAFSSSSRLKEQSPELNENSGSEFESLDMETRTKELKFFLHAELRAYFEELESRVDTFDWLLFKITMMAITRNGDNNLNRYFNIANASQGGPVKVTAMHFAAIYGNLSLCRLLYMRCSGSNFSVNPNVFIPNDQSSYDKSMAAANHCDGYDWSQYRYGMITPLRLAMTYNQLSVVRYLEQIGGKAGKAVVASLQHNTVGSVFARMGAPGFSRLPKNGCWTSRAGDEILYINVYMNGERVYPGILFKRGHDVMADGEPEIDDYLI